MDKAYDHENSEVLLCKLRRANNNEGGRGDGREKPQESEGKKEEAPSAVQEAAAGTGVCAAGAGGEAEGDGSAVFAKTVCSDKGDAGSTNSVGPAAAAAEAADGLSLAGLSLSRSSPSSDARETVDANGGGSNGGALLTTVTGNDPLR